MSDERLCLCYPVCGRQLREAPRWSGAERSPIELGKRSSRFCPNTAKAEDNGEITALIRQWHPLEAENRRALARPARKVRPLADLLRPLQPLEARRHLGSLAGPRPDQERRARRSRVGGERGRHGNPGPPTRCGRQERTASTADEKGALEPRRRGFGAQQGRFLHQAASSLRRQGTPALGGDHCGPTPRQHSA